MLDGESPGDSDSRGGTHVAGVNVDLQKGVPMAEGDDVCAQLTLTHVDGGPALLNELVSSCACHGRIDVWPSACSSLEVGVFGLRAHVFQLLGGGLAGTALNPWAEDRAATKDRAAPPRGATLHIGRGRVDQADEQSRELHTGSIWEASRPTQADQGLGFWCRPGREPARRAA